ncbi:MAG: BNR-4 repeat-containing protein [Victivallales bacterium]|nr:BNR-4 repeat-containing protein [Victivallales bacterium]
MMLKYQFKKTIKQCFLFCIAVFTMHPGTVPAGERKGVQLRDNSYAVVEDWISNHQDNFSVAAWVKLPRNTGNHTIMNQGESAQLFSFYLRDKKIRMLIEERPCITKVAQAPLKEIKQWVHFTGVYDGNNVRIYKNGKLIQSKVAGKRTVGGNDSLYIAAEMAGSRYFGGHLDDVAYWNKALSADEVKELAANKSPLEVAGNSLAGLWNASTFDMKNKIWKNAKSNRFHAIIKEAAPIRHSQKSPDDLKNYRATGKNTFINKKFDGYWGVWYAIQPLPNNEYVYKYSGGFGTYTAKHRPLAIHAPNVNKTFFVYGGALKDNNRKLFIMAGCYDHNNDTVTRPTALLDKQTGDAHDNPSMCIDGEGRILVFCTSHGRNRFSYVYRSKKPYDIDSFEILPVTKLDGKGKRIPMVNFSYLQPWYVAGKGFITFFTYYGPGRQIFYMTSKDGIEWSEWKCIANIERGDYQISMANEKIAGTAFNFHPASPKGRIGVNYRSNLYYVQTRDLGKNWETADGKRIKLPLTEKLNPALTHEYQQEGLLVYVKDLVFDADNHPVILYVTSKGFESGPANDPRTWKTARWNGKAWERKTAMRSDNNYDTGSLYIEKDGTWRIIGPTEPGPQPYNPGGEVAMWESKDQGSTWKMVKQLTRNSKFNHTYVRSALNPAPEFYAFWADGHGREQSDSSIYFCDKNGNVRLLPREMNSNTAKPKTIK